MDEVYLRESLSLYELATLSMEQVTLAGNNVALFLTVTSGYLVAAYFGAEKLEKPQVRLLNLLYILSVIYFASGFVLAMGQSAAYEWLIPRPQFAKIVHIIFNVYSVLLFLFMLLTVPAGLKFMTVMRSKNSDG